MHITESTALFGAANSLAGIVSIPETPDPRLPAVVLLAPAQYPRWGPHRLYVLLARHLAGLGFTTLRFNFSGVGESLRREDEIPEDEAQLLETSEAMDYLDRVHGVRRYLAVGLCRSAWIALHTARRDSRLAGLVLLNPQSLASERQSALHLNAKSRRTLEQSIRRGSSWHRFFSGKADYRGKLAMLRTVVRDRLNPSPLEAEIDEATGHLTELDTRGVRILVVVGDWADEHFDPCMDAILQKSRMSGLRKEVIAGCDHAFTPLAAQRALVEIIDKWLRNWA